jgi:hypothetical protein
MIAVITTIQLPSEATKVLVDKVGKGNVIVIGDKKTPPYKLEGAEFYPWDHPWQFKLAGLLPYNSYSRKNLGYLLAQTLTKCIYETDDDTQIQYDWLPKFLHARAYTVNSDLFCNAYKFFSKEDIWPRGLPLKYIDADPSIVSEYEDEFPLQQCLVNCDPDVDSIWRMRYGNKNINFHRHPPVSLDGWCPTNSQNTWWFEQAFPLMYLPSTCTIRATDIWRGLIAQKCLWQMNHNVVFHGSDAFQERNPHNVLNDFKLEVPVYLYTEQIIELLNSLELGDDTCKNLLKCYEILVKNSIFDKKELMLVNAWIEDYENIRRN